MWLPRWTQTIVLVAMTSGALSDGEDDDELPASDTGFPLHDAVYQNDLEGIASVLGQLEAMPDEMRRRALDEADDNDLTALQMAGYMDHATAASALIAAGAALETKVAGKEMTALHWAAAQGSTAVLDALVEAGADLDARDGSSEESGLVRIGRTALHYTAARGHNEAAGLLIRASGPAMLEALSARGTTPLQLASEHGHVAVIEALAAAGANLAAAADDGMMAPLHVAAAMGHADAVSALLGAGAAVDPRDAEQRTPLALAASYGRAEVVAVLLAAGADGSAKDADGKSATEMRDEL